MLIKINPVDAMKQINNFRWSHIFRRQGNISFSVCDVYHRYNSINGHVLQIFAFIEIFQARHRYLFELRYEMLLAYILNEGTWCCSRRDLNLCDNIPDSKVHGANLGPIWGRQDPGGPHVGRMNFVSGVLEDKYAFTVTDIFSFWRYFHS